ncbi:hypothetical protein [Leptothermofonsia sichuanensis]|jgi:hypothetical protein|uniref:hypothetical protein n=1 Tax=Leptothermofonsia sichuanensis TaxID=2917832 RepID=UPI0036F39EB2
MDELMPVLKEFAQQPIAFMGGFFSGVCRLNLSDDPVKSWLDKQAGVASTPVDEFNNGKSRGPQSISIE